VKSPRSRVIAVIARHRKKQNLTADERGFARIGKQVAGEGAKRRLPELPKSPELPKLKTKNLTTDNAEGTDQKTPKSELYTDLPSLRTKN
jgi:hypothetical protein